MYKTKSLLCSSNLHEASRSQRCPRFKSLTEVVRHMADGLGEMKQMVAGKHTGVKAILDAIAKCLPLSDNEFNMKRRKKTEQFKL